MTDNTLSRMEAIDQKLRRITDTIRNAPNRQPPATLPIPAGIAGQLEILSDKTLFITAAIDAMSDIELSPSPLLNGLLASLSDIYTGINELIPDRHPAKTHHPDPPPHHNPPAL